MTGRNDVPEYLNELIPYRCPKCGHLRRFATLRELHQHLHTEHSFQMGFSKPHTRACVFKRTNDVINDSSDQLPYKSLHDYEKISRKDNRLNNSKADFRESSPVLESFKEEKERLEKELQRAIQTEMKNKTISMQNLSGNTISTDRQTSLNPIHREQNSNELPSRVYTHDTTAHQPFVEKTKLSSYARVADPAMNTTMSTLNSDMLKSRMNQWVTTDALYKSQELLNEMEASAENKCQEQRNIIQHLINDMKMKDEQIELSKKRHFDLKNEREKLLKETEALALETDTYNGRLQHELSNKHGELNDLNRELNRLRKLSEHELHLKSQDLQQATGKVKRLELERDNLIQETEKILKLADVDNDQLKKQLKQKETELQNVNESLNQIRLQQEQMLERTMDVYQSSEDGREIMQTAIKTKDSQLQQALQQIENMSSLQQRLVEQSRVLTDQADDNTANMKRLLHAKAKQMEDLMVELETLRSEKRHLEGNSACLADQAESSTSAIESLKCMVKQKEDELKATQCELQDLRNFLKSAADKEKVARQRLELFIEDLIDRAERAESELKSLKSQSADTFNNEDSTERKSLPSMLHQIQQKSFDSAQAIRMPETFVEDSDTFVENILHKNVRLRNNTNNSEYDEPAYCPEETDDVITCINQTSPHPLQESGGFNVIKTHIDERNLIQTSLHRKTHMPDDDADGDIESYSLNSKNTDKRQISKSRRSRSVSQYRMTDSDSILDDNSHRKNVTHSSKRHMMKYHPGKSNTKDEAHTSRGNQHYSDSTSEANDGRRKYQASNGQENTVSRGLQVGAFLSLQNVQGDATCDDSDNCSTYSYESDDQIEEYINADLPHESNDIEIKTSNTTSKGKRPATIGKSHRHMNTTKKKIRQKKAALNNGFDTNFPIVHRSMVDVSGDFRDLSEGEVRYRDRRSRSLSPRAMDAQQFSMVPDITRTELSKIGKPKESCQQDEDLEQSMDTTVTDDLSNEFDKSRHENIEQTDGAFKNIMDENGILWDDDMATLPDVSDSELDRVSPSGSEAISSKRRALQTNKAATNSPSKDSIQSVPIKSHARRNKRNDSLVSPSISNAVYIPNKSNKGDDLVYRNKSSSTMSNTDNKCVSFRTRSLSGTRSQREHVVGSISDKIFKPIASPGENKGSVSDKDMSSGGREVNSYMRKSPIIEIHGSNETKSFTDMSSKSLSNTNSKSRSRMSKILIPDSKYQTLASYSDRPSGKKTQTIDNEDIQIHERIERISQKYSPKHVKTSPELERSSNIEDKVLSINEKYNRRRHDILLSKGISAMTEKTSKRSIGPKHNEKRPPDRIARARIKQSAIHSSGHREQELPTTNLYDPFGFSRIPVNAQNTLPSQPLPYTDFTRVPPHASFTGVQFGTQDGVIERGSSVPNPQMPPMYPYLPNYMMHPYTLGAFPHGSSVGHFPLQDGMLPHAYHGHSQPFSQDQSALSHTSSAVADNTSMSKEQPENNPATSNVQTGNVANKRDTDTNSKTGMNDISKMESNAIADQSPDFVNTGNFQDNDTGNDAPEKSKHYVPFSESSASVQTGFTQYTEECDGAALRNNPYPETIERNTLDYERDELVDQCNATSPTRKTKGGEKYQDDIEIKHFDPRVINTDFTASKIADKSLHDMPLADEPLPVSNSLSISPNRDIIVDERLAVEYAEEMDHEVKEIDTAYEDCQSYVSPNMKSESSNQSSNAYTDSSGEVKRHIEQQDQLGRSAPHLSLFDDIDRIDSSVGLSNFSVFAEEIGDDTSLGYETNSYLELPGNVTETELDGETDTESVRRDFYEKSKHIKEVLEASHNDITDCRTTTMSSTSSQG